MKGDIVFGMVLGAIVGMTIATFCKDAQTIVKKSADTIATETKNLVKKVKGE